jgi:membrane protease subunit (stomatin/prohibitin family)
MSIFKKNPNEVNYPDGKKPFLSVIKNDGPADVLCWKVPTEDFNTNSQLIVAESEEALFFKDGIIEEIFQGGKYSLSTNNYPFISRLRTAFSGGISSFNCKVYYVSKAHKLELLWGTDRPIQMRDPVYNLQTSIKARGSYSIQVMEPKKLLIKLIGNNVQMFTKDELSNYFRSAFLQFIKSGIARTIRESKQEILGICAEQDVIAGKLADILNETLQEYGVRVVNFYISGIDIPEDDPNRLKLNELYTQKAGIGILGQDWGKVQATEILHDLAKNPGVGTTAGMGMGLGVGMGAGQVIGTMAAEMFKNAAPQTQGPPQGSPQQPSKYTQKSNIAQGEGNVLCPECAAVNALGAKFCNECGAKMQGKTVHCSNCGIEMPATAKFCNECGTKR